MQRLIRIFSLVALCWACSAIAQTYPDRPIRIVVGFAPGGATDALARAIANHLTERWGQPVVVENRTGANGMIAAEAIAKATPDGYSMLMASPGEIAVNPALYAKMTYDPKKDFIGVTLVGDTPLILVVDPSSPVHSVKDLVALARSKPGELTYASAGAGSAPHLAAKYLELLTGTTLLHVPYKGGSQVIQAMLSHEVSIYFSGLTPAIAQIKAGHLRAIAVTGFKRAPLMPDIPTFEESGLKGFDITNWFALFMPAGTPKTIVSKTQREVSGILKLPAVRAQLAAQGLDAIGSSSSDLDSYVRKQSANYADLIKRAGIHIE